MISRLCKVSKSQSFFLLGPRGSGKSTFLKEIFKSQKVLWIDLLNQKLDMQLQQNPDALLEMHAARPTSWVVIDEVQKNAKLLDVVHRGIEEFGIKFALTGSSARKLKRNHANLLAGRAVEKKLLPFSALELKEKFDLNHALKYGMLPKVWSADLEESDKSDFLYAYVNTYLKEEIAAEQLVRSLEPFRRFLVSAAQSNGKIINHSAIERDCGVPRKQSERHFEILADTLIGSYLEPFDTSIRKRQTQKSKFYFFDTGIVRALQNLAAEEIMTSTFEYGDLFETFLINEFIKLNEALQKRWRLSYYQSSANTEVDLIIEKPRGAPIVIEIKSSSKIQKDKLTSFFRIKSEIKHSAAYVLSNDKQHLEIEGAQCMHWLAGLKQIFEV